MANKDLENKFYKNMSKDFKNSAKATYENFLYFKHEIIPKENKYATNFLNGIWNASKRYIGLVLLYDQKEISNTYGKEKFEIISELSDSRKFAHDSLISKINSAKRFFIDMKLFFLELPNTNEINRKPSAEYANKLVAGEYLKNTKK